MPKKIILISIFLVGILTFTACGQTQNNQSQPIPEEKPAPTNKASNEEHPASNPEQPATKNETSVQEDPYYIFGSAEFDSVVTGYLTSEKTNVFGEEITKAYLVITDFQDENLRKSIDAGINRGNGVNKKENDLYFFNLGCLENNTLKGDDLGEELPYLDQKTETAILKSSKTNPVTLNLHFDYHAGSGCLCCNLAHQIRLVK